jgi:hypothetical protein
VGGDLCLARSMMENRGPFRLYRLIIMDACEFRPQSDAAQTFAAFIAS